MDVIEVHNQDEMDKVPVDYNGKIYIKSDSRIIINEKFIYSVEVHGNSSVEAYGDSSVEAYGDSSVEVHGNSSVEAYGDSSVVAWNNSSVEAYDNSSIVAWNNSSVEAYDNSSIVAWGNSSVVARGNNSVETRDNSSVEAYGDSSVVAWDNSSVEAYDNSSVEAWGNSQIMNCSNNAKITINANAREVFMPKNIEEFMSFYGIKNDGENATFYKAVHKIDGRYFSNYDDNFKYEPGYDYYEKNCDTNVNKNCGIGIHIAHKSWCLSFGCDWKDLAILEVSVAIKDIIVPLGTTGKVRTSHIKVLREVPLEECGTYGKILAKKK